MVAGRRQLAPLRSFGFARVFLAGLASSLGTLLAAVALAVDVKDRTNSGIWVAGVLVVEFLPTVLVGLALGPLLDRLSRRSLMIGADLCRAAVFAALPFAPNAATIVALAAVAGLATGFFRPALNAGLPNLVPEDELAHANSLLLVTENVSWSIGPVLGGLLVAVAGPSAAYGINAASFVVSAVLLAHVPARLLQSATALTRGYWRDLLDGWAVVRSSAPLVTVTVVWSAAMIGCAFVNVGQVFLAKNVLHAGDFGYGLLFGAAGVGLVLGNVVGASLESRVRMSFLYGGGILLMGIGWGTAAGAPDVWVAAPLCVVGGLGNGIAGVCNPLLVQRGAPDVLRGRAITVVMSVNYVVLGLAMAAAGPVIDRLGARATWGIAGGVFAATAVLAVWMAARRAQDLPAGAVATDAGGFTA
ncbi:MAG TPA: MFS transporter [Candidatus Binatia bacterium]|nr:MFS transporter [Candidatus Binatia bacterium]